MMKNKDFCVFIISHGRPNNVYTYKDIIKRGYTGKIYIVVDNTDITIKDYINLFGSETVVTFDKVQISKTIDQGDNFNNLRTTTHARNACFDIAKKLNITYFLVLDDDYVDFQYRINHKGEYPSGKFSTHKKLDNLFDIILNYYKTITATSIAVAQGGDYIGGSENGIFESIYQRRKCMNTWFCSIDRPFKFISRLNEDVNTYMTLGSIGYLFMTIPLLSIKQVETQKTSGGMTEAYLEGGTYVKSFYSVMYCPAFAKIGLMGNCNKRIHHHISWKHAVPLIISEKYKKY